MHRRELTLLASRNALTRDFPRIIGLIRDGRIDTRPWITHHARLEEVPAVFPGWLEPAAAMTAPAVSASFILVSIPPFSCPNERADYSSDNP